MFCFCNYFCVCHCKHKWYFLWFAKKSLNSVWLQLFCECDCNQNLSVVANMTVSVWLKLLVCFCYLWLQAWVVSDCNTGVIVTTKTKSMYSVCKLFCVCHCKTLQVIFMIAKKPKQCVFATIFRAWLQPEVICGCTTAESVWLNLLGYLVIYDCKPR
jgi:hypothetical protein